MRSLNIIQEKQAGDYFVSSDPSRLAITFIHNRMANESYWSKGIPLELVERLVRIPFVWRYQSNGQQVGFGRVITDYTTFAWVTDVFVIDEHRGKGLSRLLMNAILEHPEMRVIRRWLLGTDLAHGLYRKLGFGDLDHPENFLTMHRSQMYTSGQYDELLADFIKDL
jgi:ribosomal protein S18 acetylase RimI-like enzyme